MQPLSKNGFDIEIDDHHVFLKLFAARQKIAVFVKDQAVTVKYQFILAADKIVVGHDHRIVGCAGGEHTFAPVALSGVIRRRRNVDDDFRAAR